MVIPYYFFEIDRGFLVCKSHPFINIFIEWKLQLKDFICLQ